MSGNEGPNKITELLKDASIAMLTTLSPRGEADQPADGHPGSGV